MRRLPYSAIVLNLGILFVAVFVGSFMLGRYPIPPKELFLIPISKVVPIEQYWTDQFATVLFNIRLPRIVLACLVGCCLSAAGAAYQGIFQNPMAAPDILGASAGAAFGAALAILHGGSSQVITLSAFCFGLITVALVYAISENTQGKRVLGLILSGIMVSSLFSAGTSFIKLVADPYNQLPAITYWLMGSLAGADLGDVQFRGFPHWRRVSFLCSF